MLKFVVSGLTGSQKTIYIGDFKYIWSYKNRKETLAYRNTFHVGNPGWQFLPHVCFMCSSSSFFLVFEMMALGLNVRKGWIHSADINGILPMIMEIIIPPIPKLYLCLENSTAAAKNRAYILEKSTLRRCLYMEDISSCLNSGKPFNHKMLVIEFFIFWRSYLKFFCFYSF